MTVSSIVPVNNYTGNSSTVKFDFDFLIEEENELVVQHMDANGITSILQYNVDYSIKEIGNKNGSYITFPLSGSSYKVLGNDEHITLSLSLQIKQESEFHNSSYFNLNILEWTFDYIVRILQILSRKVDRCVKVEESISPLPDEIMDELNNKCSKVHLAYSQIVDLSEEMENYKDISVNCSNNAQKQANIAKEQVTLATNQANIATQKTTEVVQNANNALSDIENKKTASINSINSTTSTQISNIKTEGTKQVDLAKAQVTLATEQAGIAEEQAKLASINAKEASLIIGLSIAMHCSDDYVPDGTLPCDGGEYSKTQFPSLWNNYLTGSTVKLDTCSYAEHANEIATNGECKKFAVDTTNGKFKVPLLKDVQKKVTNNINYANPVETSVYPLETSPFTAPFDGVFVHALSGNKNVVVYGYLNGVKTPYTFTDGDNTHVPREIIVPMSKGDTFYWDGSSYTCNGAFYAYKEVTEEKLKSFVVVANGQVNETQMDWNKWATSLEGRLTKDITNITALGKTKITDLLSPDFTSGVEKTWGETYSTEVSGWLYYNIRFATTASATIDDYTCLWIDEIPVGTAGGQKGTSSSANSGFVKIGKGSTYRTANPEGTGYSAQCIRFYPDKGN